MSKSVSDLEILLQSITPGYKSADDQFFAPVNKALIPEFIKLGVITNEEADEDVVSADTAAAVNVDCNVPGCRETFNNVHDYQSHYNTAHRFLCSTCKRVLPTAHLLDLHISETHDSFFQARVARGDAMYACYLEECQQKMISPPERKEHYIAVHKFPANFRFDQTSNKKLKKANYEMEVDMPESTDAAKKVKAFTFGHNKERSFNKKCTRRPAGATLENLNDLKAALDE